MLRSTVEGSLSSRASAGEGVEGRQVEAQGLFAKLRSVLVADGFVNLMVVTSLGIGFFHGWLKLRYRSAITTFLFDIVLMVALVVVFFRAGSLKRFFPPGRTAAALLAFYGLCLAYLPVAFVPGMPPFLVALSTLRGWIFGTLLYGLGYQIIRSRSQMHGYFLIILLFSLVTAVYGIRQSDEEVIQMMKEDAYFARRYQGQGYVDAEGDFHVRRFSTFISSGAFGGTMATALILGGALFLAPRTRMMERVLVGASMVPMGYGLLLSGARSGVITAVVGFFTLLAFRRKLMAGIVIAGVMGIGAMLAVQATGGGVMDRLATLNLKNIVYRFWWPTFMGLDYMSSHPLGGGVGKTGAAPTFIKYQSDYRDYYSPDGDLGRLMVEFGVVGLIIFGRLAWTSAKSMYEAVRVTRETESASLVLAAATNLWISILFIGVGSPFVGIPMGVLVWFFVGASERLREIESVRATLPAVPVAEEKAAGRSGRAPSARVLAGLEGRPARRFLYAGGEAARSAKPTAPAPATVAGPPAVADCGAGDSLTPDRQAEKEAPRKVFLYMKNPGSRTRASAGASVRGKPHA